MNTMTNFAVLTIENLTNVNGGMLQDGFLSDEAFIPGEGFARCAKIARCENPDSMVFLR